MSVCESPTNFGLSLQLVPILSKLREIRGELLALDAHLRMKRRATQSPNATSSDFVLHLLALEDELAIETGSSHAIMFRGTTRSVKALKAAVEQQREETSFGLRRYTQKSHIYTHK